MKITYIANSRIPTEKAYGVSIVKTCEALANTGVRVALWIPNVKNTAGDNIFSYYGIKNNFTVRRVPAFDAVALGWKYGFLLNQISFALSMFSLYQGGKREDIIITRDEISGLLLRLRGHRVFYDMHGFPEEHLSMWKIALRRMSGIITTNEWKIDQCYNLFNIPRMKMVIARNGFDPKLFSQRYPQKELRETLGLPLHKKIVLYAGHLYDWKGVFILLEAAYLTNTRSIPPNVVFVFVGGTPWDIEMFKKKAEKIPNVIIVGQKSHAKMPLYLQAADVLVLPNSVMSVKSPRFSVYSRFDTSPIKLFEYMASGRPIVASDLPSIREILNEKNAVLVEPDSAEGLRRGIEIILSSRRLTEYVSSEALADVKKYTWERRARIIIGFTQKHA